MIVLKEDKQGKQPPLLYDGPFNIGNFTFGLYRSSSSLHYIEISSLLVFLRGCPFFLNYFSIQMVSKCGLHSNQSIAIGVRED